MIFSSPATWIAVGTLLGAAGSFFVNYRNGQNKGSQEVIVLKNELIQSLKEEIIRKETTYQKQLDDMRRENAQMAKDFIEVQAQLKLAQERIKELQDLVQGRDPQNTELSFMAREFMKQVGMDMTAMRVQLGEVHDKIITQ